MMILLKYSGVYYFESSVVMVFYEQVKFLSLISWNVEEIRAERKPPPFTGEMTNFLTWSVPSEI